MAENLSARYGRHFGTFWKAANAARYFHAPPLGWRSGVGADGKEHCVVEFDDAVAYVDNHLVWFKSVAGEPWLVTNDRSASLGIPAGVLHVPTGTAAPGDGDRGFIQIKGETLVKKEGVAVVAGGGVASHAATDGAIESTALTTVAHMLQVVGYVQQAATAAAAHASVRLALPWA